MGGHRPRESEYEDRPCGRSRPGQDGQDRYSEDDLPLDPGFAEVLLTWKRRLGAEREAQNGISTRWGWTWSFQAPPPDGTSMRRRHSRTTSVRLAAVLWRVQNAARVSVSGVFRMPRLRTGSSCRCTMSGGVLPGSTASRVAYLPPYLPFPGWRALQRPTACSRN